MHTNSGPANFAAYLIAHGGTYNGITVSSLGLTKSKQLWYRTMHQLTSGADYAALGRTLSSACLQLVGHGFTRADCAEVNKAADATNMGSWAFPRNVLCSVGTPVVPVNDLESRTGFTLTSPIWQYIPSPDVPVRVAYSGTTALYAFAQPGEVGYAELNTQFVVPPSTGAGAPNVVLRARRSPAAVASGSRATPGPGGRRSPI